VVSAKKGFTRRTPKIAEHHRGETGMRFARSAYFLPP
jgi:hypothetical protein